MLNVYYPESVHRINMSTDVLHWTTQPLFFSEMTIGDEYASYLRKIFGKRQNKGIQRTFFSINRR